MIIPEEGSPPQVLARAEGPHGETVLRLRAGVFELVVNGCFAMDTAHPHTEAALATMALDLLTARESGWWITVGGLGLGITLRALLDDHRVTGVNVIELDPALPRWLAADLVPGAAASLTDPRVRLHVGDAAQLIPALSAGADAVLLDVDNGPDFLVHEQNAVIYQVGFLSGTLSRLRSGGVLAIWSADPSAALLAALRATGARVLERLVPVHRDGRHFEYAIYLAQRR